MTVAKTPLAKATICALVFAATVVHAGPVGYRSIPDLVAASDTIVVGQVAAIETSEGGDAGVLVLLVSKVLDGKAQGGPLRIAYKQMRVGLGDSIVGKRALVFANQVSGAADLELVPLLDGDGTYLERQVLAADFPVAGPLVAGAPQDTTIQKVIKEMVTIQVHSNSSNAMVHLMSLAWSGKEQPTLRRAFQAMRQSAAANGLALGTTGLVGLGGLDGLESLHAARAQGAQVDGAFDLLERFYGSSDPRGVEILEQWLNPGSPDHMRAAAAGALARVHTPAALIVLGPALRDPDFQVRWRAIGGLSMFANNIPIGGAGPSAGTWPFRTGDTIRHSVYDEELVRENENFYLDFWRAWWSENQEAVQALVDEAAR